VIPKSTGKGQGDAAATVADGLGATVGVGEAAVALGVGDGAGVVLGVGDGCGVGLGDAAGFGVGVGEDFAASTMEVVAKARQQMQPIRRLLTR